MRQISIASFDILILKGKPVLHKKRKDCNGLVAMANSCMCLNQSAHLLELGLRIRIRSDPVFLPGSGSGFQISLDPDTDPVSVPGFWISSPDPMRKSVQNCSKSYLLGKT